MNPLHIILMLVIFALALRQMRKDFVTGLALVAGLLVSMPDYLRISFGGGIPELTIQRLLLLGLLLCYPAAAKLRPAPLPVPFAGGLIALGVAQFLAMLFSVHFMGSLKWFVNFIMEVAVFFVIISRTIHSREEVLVVLRAVAVGLGGVAVIAGIEKYQGVNWPRYLLTGGGIGEFDITATYPHRILMGYAMAMAVPVIFAVYEREQTKFWRRLLLVMVLAVVAGCYFSNSRGPWSGMILGGAMLFVLGSWATRRTFLMLGLAGLLLAAAKPGVRETIWSAVSSTFYEKDSLKSKSYEYRWRLWHVAFSEIKKSPERTLFGYGGLSTETMDLADYFEKEAGGTAATLGYTSWDNQLACDLIEYGLLGFGIEVVLLAMILGRFILTAYRGDKQDRCILAAFVSAGAIYLYAMTNVYIFSPQLRCLFWTLVACGIRFGQLKYAEAKTASKPPEEPLADFGPRRRPRFPSPPVVG